MIGCGGHQHFLKIIRDREVKKCLVTMDDAQNAFTIFEKNLNSIRGNTTRTKTDHVPSNKRIPLPLDITQAHKNVTLIDYRSVDKMTFLVTTSRNLHFITIENITTRAIISHCRPGLIVSNTHMVCP